MSGSTVTPTVTKALSRYVTGEPISLSGSPFEEMEVTTSGRPTRVVVVVFTVTHLNGCGGGTTEDGGPKIRTRRVPSVGPDGFEVFVPVNTVERPFQR